MINKDRLLTQVLKEAKNLVALIYRLTDSGACQEQLFCNQLRHTALMIADNIIQGDDEQNKPVTFLCIAETSLSAIATKAQIAFTGGYIGLKDLLEINKQCQIIETKLRALIAERTIKILQ